MKTFLTLLILGVALLWGVTELNKPLPGFEDAVDLAVYGPSHSELKVTHPTGMQQTIESHELQPAAQIKQDKLHNYEF